MGIAGMAEIQSQNSSGLSRRWDIKPSMEYL